VKSRQDTSIAWLIWLVAVSFYFYEFVIRISPSVMVNQIAWSFHVDAAALGAMSAFYLYAYAPMQLPVGLLMDRYGARRLLTAAAAICGVGGVVFGLSRGLALADFGRVLMGFGSAFAYVGIIFVSSHWFSPARLPLLVGLGTSVGMLGAVVGEYPIAFAVGAFGWRETAIGFGIIGFILAVITYLIIRASRSGDPPLRIHDPNKPHIWKNLANICRNGQTWINGIISLCMYASTVAFAGLWCPSFLEATYGMTRDTAGGFSSAIFLGWLIGGPLVTYLAMITARRRTFLMIGSLFGFCTIALVVYVAHIPAVILFILLFLTGIFSSCQVITFTLAVELNDRRAKGSAAALTNFLVMLAGSIIQPLVGTILDMTAHIKPGTAILVYTFDDFRVALTIFPASFLVALIFCFFLRSSRQARKGEILIVPPLED
jgi:MFS family permease